MPANLTPEYFKAEERFREAKTDEERLLCLKEMLRVIPKHKGTDHLCGDLKRKISKLKEKLEQTRRSGKRGSTHKLESEGAGLVALVGVPNVGKTQMLCSLSSIEAEVAPYPFTTRNEQPGMMPYEDISIQLVDLPPFTRAHTEHWMYELVRICDALVLVVDLQAPDPTEQLTETLECLAKGYVFPIPPGRRPVPGVRDKEMRALLVANKMDGSEGDDLFGLFREFVQTDLPILPVSAREGTGLDEVRQAIFAMLDVIRVYSKPPGKEADLTEPFTVPKGSTIAEVASVVHKDLGSKVQHARIWGGAKFDGQTVGRDYVVQDRDIVELHC